MSAGSERLLLTPDEVSRELGFSRSKVYDLIRDGALPSVRLGDRGVRVPREALTRLLDELATPTK